MTRVHFDRQAFRHPRIVRCGALSITLWTAVATLAPGCGGGSDAADDYSDTTWSSPLSEGAAAVLDEDLTGAPAADDAVDGTPDPSEAADTDPDAESEQIAAVPPNEAPGESDPQTDNGLGLTDVKHPAAYRNAIAQNCADPGVIRIDGKTPMFYATCTGNGFPRFQSTDLVHWQSAGHLFDAKDRPAWGAGDWWAPEIHHIGDHFVAYFAALSKKRGKICIGAAHATSATGPFTDLGRPLVCNAHVSLIDPTLTTTSDGRHFLYFKTDGNGLSPQQPTVIYGHELGADGISVKPGRSTPLIQNRLAWEGDVVEAPWIKQRGKYTYLFYSGYRYCNGTYGVGVARARSPLGPFRKKGAPILRSNAAWDGPGHNSIVGANGHDYIVYHAWKGAHQCSDGGDRELMLDRVGWKDGWPEVNNGTPSRTPRAIP